MTPSETPAGIIARHLEGQARYPRASADHILDVLQEAGYAVVQRPKFTKWTTPDGGRELDLRGLVGEGQVIGRTTVSAEELTHANAPVEDLAEQKLRREYLEELGKVLGVIR